MEILYFWILRDQAQPLKYRVRTPNTDKRANKPLAVRAAGPVASDPLIAEVEANTTIHPFI